jgi:REP element-mobilizing transposase RayT
VTLRIVDGAPSLRRTELVGLIRRSISRAHREGFGIAEFNVEPNHLHLIVEAESNRARECGLKGLNSSIALSINRKIGRRGRLFADRYHARSLKTPREVRNALRYVLNNARHHELSSQYDSDWIDPCSSAPWFRGCREPVRPNTWWKRELLAQPSPVAEPKTWLLRAGWRRHGEIAFDEVPGGSARGNRVREDSEVAVEGCAPARRSPRKRE